MAAPPVFGSSHDLLDLLECPVCMELMHAPIYQCPNGHPLCKDCKSNVSDMCPICREHLGDIRALVLEKMGASLRFPCKNREQGCSEMLRFDAKQRHEEECGYSPYMCPFTCTPCSVTGDAETLLVHLRIDHLSEIVEGHEIDTVFSHQNPCNGENTSLNVSVYRCHHQSFCLHFEAMTSPIDMVYLVFLTFMGDEINAMDYRYNLEIGNGLHKLTWQGMPRSIREGIQQIRDSYDGLVIHSNVAQRFAELNSMETLMLRIKGIIWKET